MRRLRHWILPFLWATAIWSFSTQWFSSDSTSHWILPLLHWLLPRAQPPTLWMLHVVIRKCGHVVEYLIFSLLVLRGIRGDRQGLRLSWALTALAVAVGYASLDELHQAFAPGRTPAVRDVLLDSFGAVLGQLIAWWLTGRADRETVAARE